MKIVCISDSHNKHDDIMIPSCDILISAGDYSSRGLPQEVRNFHQWLNNQDAKHIISVQGNHELWVENNFNDAKLIATEVCPNIHFIDEGLVQVESLNIWCSAVTPWFCNWAWNRQRGDEIRRHWDLIPDNTDIIITHGPPYGYGDDTMFDGPVGCVDLRDAINRVRPTLHISGHIHYGYGVYKNDHTTFINASICDESYNPTNKPIVIDIR